MYTKDIGGYMRFISDSQRRAVFAKINYNASTWQKEIAGIPKAKIGQFYERQWPVIKPQVEGRNVLTRNIYDGSVVKRHPPDSQRYQRIKDKDDLLELVRRHAVEFLPETGKADDVTHTSRMIIDIDPQGKIPSKKVKRVAKDAAEEMKRLPAVKNVYLVNTNDGFHVIGNLNTKLTYNEAKKRMRHNLFPNIEEGDVKRRRGGVYLDLAPMKKRGSTRIYGGLNYPSMTIAEKLKPSEIMGFKPRRLK